MNENINPTYVNARQTTFDLVKPAFEVFKRNWLAFLVVNVLFVVPAFLSIFSSEPSKQASQQQAQELVSSISGVPASQILTIIGVSAVVVLLFVLVGMFFQAMATSLQLKSTAGATPSLGELFRDGRKYFWRLTLLSLAAGAIIIGGLILLIVPGVIAIGRLFLAPEHLIDKDLSVKQALKASNEQAKQHGKQVWLVIGALLGLGLLASTLDFIPLVGGLLSSLAVIVLSILPTLRYQQLKLPNYPQSKDQMSSASIPPSETTVS